MFEILSKIQTELKAPKNLRNNFGKYNYRNCEGILEAVKPLLKKYNVAIVLSDEIVNMGDRFYIKATATLQKKDGETISVSAFAREPLDKKGMDAAQITGSTSSYARKYALNGLLAIDDNKEPDDLSDKPEPVKPPKAQIPAKKYTIADLKTAKNMDELGVIYNGLGGNESATKEIKDLTKVLIKKLSK